MARPLYDGEFEKLTIQDISTDINSIAKSLTLIQRNLDDLVETVGYLVPETNKDEETTQK